MKHYRYYKYHINILSSARQLSLLPCLSKSSESELILSWYQKIKLVTLITTSYSPDSLYNLYNRLIHWLYDCLLILCYTFTSFNNSWAVCWILCMSTTQISVANYNFTSWLPNQIIKLDWSLTWLYKKIFHFAIRLFQMPQPYLDTALQNINLRKTIKST